MMEYDEAEAERFRIAGLLEDNRDYEYRSSVLPIYDEDGVLLGYAVGVGWVSLRLGEDSEFHEYGNAMAIQDVGAPIDAIKHAIHHSYMATMANLGLD